MKSVVSATLFVLLGCLFALAGGMALLLVSYLLVALGLPGRSLPAAEWASTLLGVMLGARWAARRVPEHRWRTGILVGLGVVVAWLLAWCFLMGRFDVRLWWLQALPTLTPLHGIAWGTTVLAGAMGGALAGQMRRRWALAVTGLILLALPVVMLITAAIVPVSRHLALAPGVMLQQEPPTPDGTVVTLLTLDFRQNPNLYLGLFDADLADVNPGDDSNASWLGQSIGFALPKMQTWAARHDRRLLFACNGGFFGFDPKTLLVGFHIIPMTIDGKSYYPSDQMRPKHGSQVWHFGVRRAQGRPRFELREFIPWPEWSQYETALGGVRPLRVAGKSVALKPGTGNTSLRCSRTSIGWSADSSKLSILTVFELDGEFGSIAQRSRGAQTGGWDLRQIQQFWEARQMPNAVLFDGGESSQCIYRLPAGGYRIERSAYLLSKTLGYLHGRPLRAVIPMLPPGQNHNGVLNYLYVASPGGTSR